MKISTFAFASMILAAGCESKTAPAAATQPAPAAAAPAAAAPVAAAPVAAAPAGAAPTAAAVPVAAAEPALIAVGTKMKCPVSGEDFTVKEKTQQLAYNGKRYAFCCSDCAPEFNKNPAKYAK